MTEADKLIVFDTETTGLDFDEDEILQLSIINANGKTLFNEYIKPVSKTEWTQAQKIHGITPEMVKECKTFEEYIPEIREIFDKAEILVAYNNVFDIGMLSKYGLEFEGKKQADVMKDFAVLYGEYQSEYCEFKWQKLTKCAEYFGYEFKAHDSLEDVRATLYCYKKIEEMKKSGQFEKIVNANVERIWGVPRKQKEKVL